jgi:adenosylcobinamide-phosphate guanylyltransferase
MEALVMAGGRGTRLNMGEKPLVRVLGKRLIEYVVCALEDSSVGRISVATTESAPGTREWAKRRGLMVVDTLGNGFVADMVQAVEIANIVDPVLIIMADLPLITSDLLDDIMDVYEERPEMALSTHTPLHLHSRLSRKPDSLFNYNGQLIVPAGVNILDGANIRHEQEDYHLILERMELAVNVNVAEDLRLCERVLLGDLI